MSSAVRRFQYRPTTPGTILGILAALLVMRIPLSFILLLIVPWIMIVTGALHRPSGPRTPLFAVLLGWCLIASLLSLALLHPETALSTGTNFAIMVAVIGLSLVIYRSEDPGVSARRALEGLYWGGVGVWLMALGEIVTGVKLLPVLYPDSGTVGQVASASRFFVTATYPNFNDFCVVMVMLFVGVLSKMWFDPRKGWRNLGRWVILVTAVLLVVVMGSRGALLGCLGGFALLVVLNIRRLHRAALGPRAAVFGGLLIVGVAVGLVNSSYVQDNSTAVRGRILGNALSMLAGSPGHTLLGYGSLVSYQNAAKAAFGTMLMDPHNLLLEVVLNYGVVALVLFVAVWLWIVVRGFLPRLPMVDWQAAFGLVVVVLLPLLGTVPSSTLRYHITWIYLSAVTLLTAQGAEARSALSATAAPDRDLGQPHDDNAHDEARDHSDHR